MVIWRDITEEKKTQIAAEKERIILEEQKLANLLQANELSTALQIALELERPLQVLRIVEGTKKIYNYIKKKKRKKKLIKHKDKLL